MRDPDGASFSFGAGAAAESCAVYILAFGWAGVDLFFVLSGFLITRILMRTRQRDDYFRAFYIRRTLRIFPIYYWTLALVIIIFGAVPALKAVLPPPHDPMFYWIYLSNWTPLMRELNQQSLGHFWSLAIEEQFYWFWPLAVRFVAPSWLTRAALGTFAAAVLSRIALSNWHWFIFRNTFCRTDALMVGVLCAIAWKSPMGSKYLTSRANYLGAAVPTLALAVAAGDRWLGTKFTDTFGLMALALAFGALLWYAMVGPKLIRGFFRARVLRELGKYSYGIYVYHQPIYLALLALHPVPRGWPMFAATLIISIGLAVLSYELAEKHILKLKDRQWRVTAVEPARV